MAYIYNGILLSHEKNEIMYLQQHGWTQRLSYQMKSVRKERQILYDINYLWNLKNIKNEYKYKAKIYSQI